MCHTAVSSLLPMAVYQFTMTLYRSHDSSVLACVLVAFSVHISVFATHTLISSFLSPLVFFTLPPMLSIFQLDSEIDDEDENKDCEPQEKSVIIKKNHSPANCNHQKPRINFFYNTCHYKIKKKKINSTTKTVNEKYHHLFFSGFFIGIFIYIRFDLLIFYISLSLPLVIVHWCKFLSSFWKLILIVLGFCLGIFVGATDDYYSYNSFFISPYQWFMFNVFKDFSSTLFGRSDMGFYIKHILLHNISMVTMFLATCLTLVISIIKQDIFSQTQTKNTLCLLLSTTIMFISYTLKGHKEVRFLHNFIVLLMVIYSTTFITIWQYLQARLSFLISKTATALLAMLVLIFYTGHQWCIFPGIKSFGDWNYLNNQQSGHANECLYYISQQKDVSGVFFDQSLHTSGAYSLLHLDVPMLTLIQREFYEFTHATKIHIRRHHNWLANQNPANDTVTIYALCNISNYVSIYNTQYLLKHLITRSEYNYILLKKSRQFIQLGFKQVFESGSMRVLKRIGDPVSEKNLQIIAQNISPLSSFKSEVVAGDVLLHEAHFLYSYGQYKLAEERLSAVTYLKTPRVAVYQLLFNLYRELGEENKAKLYWRKCVEKFNQTACLKTVQVTDLYALSKRW